MADDMHVHEFLYRGKPDGSGDYHVILARTVSDPFRKEDHMILSHALTPTQAEALGFGLPTLVADINVALAKTNDSLGGEVAAHKQANGALRNEVKAHSRAIRGAAALARQALAGPPGAALATLAAVADLLETESRAS